MVKRPKHASLPADPSPSRAARARFRNWAKIQGYDIVKRDRATFWCIKDGALCRIYVTSAMETDAPGTRLADLLRERGIECYDWTGSS